MAELKIRFLMMEANLRDRLSAQAQKLADLLAYLEECDALGAKEFHYCQGELQGVLGELKRLERMTSASGPS